jgi:hypothetical protein
MKQREVYALYSYVRHESDRTTNFTHNRFYIMLQNKFKDNIQKINLNRIKEKEDINPEEDNA